MHFSVSSEHTQHFNHHSEIEFENLFNSSQLKILLTTLSLMKPTPPNLKWGLYAWRKEASLKPFMTSASFGKIAGQLKNCSDIRFAYSQYLGPDCYSDKTTLLYRKSCIKELLIGLCICLESNETIESPFFPKKAGDGLFFNIDDDFYLRFPSVKGKYLFIFYCDIKARFFIQEESNEVQQAFRTLGYSNGDFLNNKLNPSYHRIHS